MKKLLTILVAVLLISNVIALSPEKMSDRAVVRAVSNTLETSTNIEQDPAYTPYAGTSIVDGHSTHYIGEEFGGGVIFHLFKDSAGVEHGLVVALTDQSTSQAWSNVRSTAIGAKAQSLQDGLSNSKAIVSQAGHTSSAAKLCLDLVSGGQSDWYLPSIQELTMLWNNFDTVEKSLSTISGATPLTKTFYWSSSESNSNDASYIHFLSGYTFSNVKYRDFYVRAVRAF